MVNLNVSASHQVISQIQSSQREQSSGIVFVYIFYVQGKFMVYTENEYDKH